VVVVEAKEAVKVIALPGHQAYEQAIPAASHAQFLGALHVTETSNGMTDTAPMPQLLCSACAPGGL